MENVRLVRSQWPGRSRSYEDPKPLRRRAKPREMTYDDGFRHGFIAATVAFAMMILTW